MTLTGPRTLSEGNFLRFKYFALILRTVTSELGEWQVGDGRARLTARWGRQELCPVSTLGRGACPSQAEKGWVRSVRGHSRTPHLYKEELDLGVQPPGKTSEASRCSGSCQRPETDWDQRAAGTPSLRPALLRGPHTLRGLPGTPDSQGWARPEGEEAGGHGWRGAAGKEATFRERGQRGQGRGRTCWVVARGLRALVDGLRRAGLSVAGSLHAVHRLRLVCALGGPVARLGLKGSRVL